MSVHWAWMYMALCKAPRQQLPQGGTVVRSGAPTPGSEAKGEKPCGWQDFGGREGGGTAGAEQAGAYPRSISGRPLSVQATCIRGHGEPWFPSCRIFVPLRLPMEEKPFMLFVLLYLYFYLG